MTTPLSVRGKDESGAVQDSPGGAAPMGKRLWHKATPYVFIVVPLGLLLLLTYWPSLNLFWYSITDWDGIAKTKNVVGLANYKAVFTDEANVRVFYVTLYYVASAFVQVGLALFFAVLLSTKVRFLNFWKGVLFFPYLINGVAISLIFLYFFRAGGGLDTFLAWLGLESWIRSWLGDPDLVNISLASVNVWRYMGFNFVIFLGAIQSISPDVLEAAKIDGANRWHEFRYITMPSIKPVVALIVILSVAGTLSMFETPYIMTGGANGSETFVVRTVKLAFQMNKVGLASAMAVVLLIFVLIVTWVQRKLIPDEEVDLT